MIKPLQVLAIFCAFIANIKMVAEDITDRKWSVMFQVDMKQAIGINPVGIYVMGNFQGYDPATCPLKDENADGIWEGTFSFDPKLLETGNILRYSFVNGNAHQWIENFTEKMPCLGKDLSRMAVLTEEKTILPVVCFGACEACYSKNTVTFHVDMNGYAVNEGGVKIIVDGRIDNSTAYTKMADVDGDGIYSITYTMPAGLHTFGFVNGKKSEWPDQSMHVLDRLYTPRSVEVKMPFEEIYCCFNSTVSRRELKRTGQAPQLFVDTENKPITVKEEDNPAILRLLDSRLVSYWSSNYKQEQGKPAVPFFELHRGIADSLYKVMYGSQGCSGVTDLEGNYYRSVKIGNQCWMSDNLRSTYYSTGAPIEGMNGSKFAGLAIYANDSCRHHYGTLYNAYAAKDAKNICPKGWHVPSVAEVEMLLEVVGGKKQAGPYLSIQHKNADIAKADSIGLFLQPGGKLTDLGMVSKVDKEIWLWTRDNVAIHINEYGYIFFEKEEEQTGMCIRCLQD
jgi:uncharacterized protein (TIGR02145 family)